MIDGVRRFLTMGWLLVPFTTVTMALEVQLDYSLDTKNFFGGPGSPQRMAMRAVADYFEELITDSLSEINPADHGGNASWIVVVTETGGLLPVEFKDVVVPRDTIIVYVRGDSLEPTVLGQGGHGLFSTPQGGDDVWKAIVETRGETNADGAPARGEGATDFGPWGGVITFNADLQWNYSLTRRIADGRLGKDFVTVALHEFCHVLGVGTSDSWKTHIDTRGNGTPVFTGAHSVKEFGRPVPMEANLLDHFQDPMFCRPGVNFNPNNPRNILSRTVEHFGVPGNRDQIVLMNPTNCVGTGVLMQVMTTLDLAALRDVGWTLKGDAEPPRPVPTLTVTPQNSLFVNGVILEWNSLLGQRYQVEWSEHLQDDWEPLGEAVFGNGSSVQVVDRDRETKRFYRLLVEEF